MFYRYEIKRQNNKDVLFLYLSMSEEEAVDFGSRNKVTIEEKVKNFIKQNNIKYDSGPIYLVMNGIIVKSMELKDNHVNIEIIDEEGFYRNDRFMVKVKNDTETTSMLLRDYLMGVLLTNVSYDYNIELLKAVAVLYRTYAYKQMGKIGYIKADDPLAPYKTISYYKLLWFHEFDLISKNIVNAIDATDSMFMTYNNLFIKPYIHNANNGSTDTLEHVDYLVKVPSLWDLTSNMYLNVNKYTIEKVAEMLDVNKKYIDNLRISELTEGGCIKKIEVGNRIFSGDEFREKLHLPSKDMTILIDDKYVTIVTRGWGHHLGLSLSGAHELTKIGCNYLQVLNYYFPTCKIKKYR